MPELKKNLKPSPGHKVRVPHKCKGYFKTGRVPLRAPALVRVYFEASPQDSPGRLMFTDARMPSEPGQRKRGLTGRRIRMNQTLRKI
jgi:hypothetical protein